MSPLWTDVVQALSSAIGLLVAIVGFLVLRHQIKQVERSVQGETHTGLYQHAFEVLKFIGEHEVVRPYLYCEVEIKEGHQDYPLAMTTAGMMASFFEHVVLQKSNLPTDVWESWIRNFKGVYDTSPVLRDYFSKHGAWYSKEMQSLVKDMNSWGTWQVPGP